MRRGRAIHASGTAPNGSIANWLKVFFTKTDGRQVRVWQVRVGNTDGSSALEVSFNNGNNFLTIAQAGPAYTGEHDLHYFHVRGNGGTCTFTAVGTSYG